MAPVGNSEGFAPAEGPAVSSVAGWGHVGVEVAEVETVVDSLGGRVRYYFHGCSSVMEVGVGPVVVDLFEDHESFRGYLTGTRRVAWPWPAFAHVAVPELVAEPAGLHVVELVEPEQQPGPEPADVGSAAAAESEPACGVGLKVTD